MLDKDLLEEIKEYFSLWMKNDISHDWSLSDETIDKLKRLIKQAELVHELEETVEDYKTVNKELHLRGRKVRKQNKRYREALEFYADRDNYKLEHFDPSLDDYMSTVDYDEGEVARKSLEGK